jgi:hypothetical protein
MRKPVRTARMHRNPRAPCTNTGGAASSRNAVKQGLFAADITQYFRTEDESQRYQRFIDGIVKDIAPVGDFETVLARRAADIQFRLEVLRTAEFKVYAGATLVKDTVEGLLDKSGDLMGLASLYDSRFQRAFSKTMEDLRRAQQSRRDKELHALEQLKAIALAHIQENATFDPAKFGFVISRDFVFNQAHLANAKKLAQFCAGEGRVEKKVVDYVARVPPKPPSQSETMQKHLEQIKHCNVSRRTTQSEPRPSRSEREASKERQRSSEDTALPRHDKVNIWDLHVSLVSLRWWPWRWPATMRRRERIGPILGRRNNS